MLNFWWMWWRAQRVAVPGWMAVEVLAYTSGHRLVRGATSFPNPCKYEEMYSSTRRRRWYVLHQTYSTSLSASPTSKTPSRLFLASSIVSLFYSYILSLALPISQLLFISHSRSSEDVTGTWLNHSSPFVLRTWDPPIIPQTPSPTIARDKHIFSL